MCPHAWPLWLVKQPVWLYISRITETKSVVIKHRKKGEGPCSKGQGWFKPIKLKEGKVDLYLRAIWE